MIRSQSVFNKILAFLIGMSAPSAFAAGIDLRIDDTTGGPGKFAGEEIRREATAKGMTFGQDSDSTQIAIIVEKAADQVTQSYRIQVEQKQGVLELFCQDLHTAPLFPASCFLDYLAEGFGMVTGWTFRPQLVASCRCRRSNV